MSLRLTPSAQRKNRVVTRIRGATYRCSVIGAEEVIALSQRAVQVHVAAVHKNMLAGDVTGAAGNEKYYHRGDLVGRGHSLFQRNLGKDGFEFFVGIWKGIEPLAIKRCH